MKNTEIHTGIKTETHDIVTSKSILSEIRQIVLTKTTLKIVFIRM